MSALATFDIRTLFVCLLLLALIFSAVFMAMKLAYRQLQGIGSLSMGFLSGAIGMSLLTSRGHIPYFVSVVVANTLVVTGFLLLYRYILVFQQSWREERHAELKFRLAAALVLVTVCILFWFTEVNDSVVPRLVILALAIGVLCACMAGELLRQAAGRLSMRLFALFMALRAIGCFYRGVLALVEGPRPAFLVPNNVQVLAMAMGILSVSLLGIFFLIIVGGELTLAVEHRASLDPLTGSLNRRGIDTILAAELDRARRNHHPLAAILIDVDRFKGINDAGGHAAGDAALRTVVRGISVGLRSYDLLGRYGGDEFLLLLPETTTIQAFEVASRIQARLILAAESLHTTLRPTVSMGIAETMAADTAESLLARADAALYDAKHAGRNCIRHRDSHGKHPVLVTPVESISLTSKPALSVPPADLSSAMLDSAPMQA